MAALYDGLRLGTLLCCLGAANALANPKRALRVLPGALYELGVAVVVTLSVAPQLVESVQRVRRARKLRGGAGRGFHAIRGIAIPVMEDALERSLRLAAAMDSRGLRPNRGRVPTDPAGDRCPAPRRDVRPVPRCLRAPRRLRARPARVSRPCCVGAVLCCLGLALGSRRVGTHASTGPTPGRHPSGWWPRRASFPAVVLMAGIGFNPGLLDPSVDPLRWPSMPLVPALAIAVAAVAAVAAPPPVRRGDDRGRPHPSSLGDPGPCTIGAGRRPDRIEVPA